MKKMVVFVTFNLVFCTVFSRIGLDDVQKAHKKEADKVTESLNELTSSLMALETDAWLKNLKKNDFNYPQNVLSESDLKSFISAIDALETGDNEKFGYRLNLPNNLEDIFNQIKNTANELNEKIGFKRGLVKFFTKERWKPVVISYFNHAKAVIKSFGPLEKAESKKQAQIKREGCSFHYFPEPKTGENMQTS